MKHREKKRQKVEIFDDGGDVSSCDNSRDSNQGKRSLSLQKRLKDICVPPDTEISPSSTCCTNSKAMIKASQTGVNFLQRDIYHKWILDEKTKKSQWYLGKKQILRQFM